MAPDPGLIASAVGLVLGSVVLLLGLSLAAHWVLGTPRLIRGAGDWLEAKAKCPTPASPANREQAGPSSEQQALAKAARQLGMPEETLHRLVAEGRLTIQAGPKGQ